MSHLTGEDHSCTQPVIRRTLRHAPPAERFEAFQEAVSANCSQARGARPGYLEHPSVISGAALSAHPEGVIAEGDNHDLRFVASGIGIRAKHTSSEVTAGGKRYSRPIKFPDL